jgi:hypothetical protein
MVFTAFDTEYGYDFLTIHNGTSTSAPIIGLYTGNTLPANGTVIVGNTGALTLHFTSDSGGNGAGFTAGWSCSNVGLPEDKNALGFEVYPNPSSGLVNLKMKNTMPEDYQIEVTNVLGKVLMQKKIALSDSKDEQLDLSQFAKGIYFIKIQNSKTSGMKKVVLD